MALKLCLVAAAVALLLFVGTLGSGFVCDDEILFRSWLPYFDSARAILSPPAGIPYFTYRCYRPALITSYLIDENLSAAAFPPGSRERGRRILFHLTPVLLHVACTVLVFLLGILLLRGRSEGDGKDAWTAFAGALLFAAHPIHVESVAWIVGRSDSLCTLAGLGALVAFLHWRGRRQWPALVGATLLLLIAVLTMEIAFGILLPLGVVAFSWREREGGSRARGARRAEVAALLVFFLTYAVLRLSSTSQAQPSVSTGGALFGLLGAVGWYAVKLVWPFPRTAFPAERLGFEFILAGLLAAGLASASFVVWRGKRWRAERAALAVVVGGILVSLAVAVTNVSTSPLAERNLYLPSAGGCLLLVFLAERLVRRSAVVRPMPVPWIALFAGLLVIPSGWAISRRLPVWDNPVRFWSEAAASAPQNAVTRINLGASLVAAGRLPEAEKAYEEALRLSTAQDQSAMAHANLGSLQLVQARLDDAIRNFGLALADDPLDATSLFNWASALTRKAQEAPAPAERVALLTEASQRLETALAIHPHYSKAHLLLGTILLGSGDAERARAELQAAASIDPGSPEGSRARALLAEPPFGLAEGRVIGADAPVR